MRPSGIITFCYLRSQSVELLCRSSGYDCGGFQLSLANGVQDFNAGNRTAGRPKGLEAKHRTREPFHCTMVLFHNVVAIPALPDRDGRLVALIVVGNRCRVAATLINRALLRESVSANRLVQEGLSG